MSTLCSTAQCLILMSLTMARWFSNSEVPTQEQPQMYVSTEFKRIS